MGQRIGDKKSQLIQETKAFENHRAELLELIRTTPAFFHQLLAHLQTSKVENFLEKDEKYRCSKEKIERLREEISQDELRERESLLIQMNLPEKMRRACVQDTCSACTFKHEWNDIIMLSCGHLLHQECFVKLRNEECPLCRTVFRKPLNSYGGHFGAGRRDSYEY